jgi:phosphate transport system protein
MRDAFANRLTELEERIGAALERAAVTLPEVAHILQDPDPASLRNIQDAGVALRHAARSVDSELVLALAREAPNASDLRLALALLEVAHHGTLVANQLNLISEQLTQVDATDLRRGDTAFHLSAMAHLAGSQLARAVGALRARDLGLALRTDVEDDEIDKLNREVFEAALALQDAPAKREVALRHVLIARCVERIADNAVDIGEQAAFVITAQPSEFTDASVPRHRSLLEPDRPAGRAA